MRTLFFFFVAAALVGCAIDESGLLPPDASPDAPIDAQADAPKDAPEEPFVCADAGPASCEDAAPYRSPVLYSPDAGAACPAGFDTRDLTYEIPASPTCTCECTDAGPPACDTTKVAYAYGSVATCGIGTGSFALSGACTQTTQTTFPSEQLQVDPPAVTGGCAGGTSIPPTATNANVRLCIPECTSDERVCNGGQGLLACVSVVGNVPSCPANYPTGPFYIGDVPQVTCDGCSCVASGDCTGSTTHLYTSNNCGAGDQPFPMDGQCHGLSGGQIATFQSAKITPNLKGGSYQCKVSPGAAHTAYGGDSFTVCCK